MNIFLQWLGRHWIPAVIASLVALMVLKKMLGGLALPTMNGFSPNWLIIGFIVCIASGQILVYYIRLKFLGWVTTIIGVVMGGVWLLGLIPSFSALQLATLVLIWHWFSEWSLLQASVGFAQFVGLVVAAYCLYRACTDPNGVITRRIGYGLIFLLTFGGIMYPLLGVEIASALGNAVLQFVRNVANMMIQALTGGETTTKQGDIQWNTPSFDWIYIVCGLGIIIGLILIFWSSKTSTPEKKGH